jgi:hypothetical protein
MFTVPGTTVPKTVTVKRPASAAAYGAGASGSDNTENWANGLRGMGWDGANVLTGAANAGITVQFEDS